MQEKLEKHSVTKKSSGLSLFQWIVFNKFLAFSLEFQKFFLVTKTIFSHSTYVIGSMSEQFW